MRYDVTQIAQIFDANLDFWFGHSQPLVFEDLNVNYVVILYTITIQTLAPRGRVHSHMPRLVLHSIRYT